MITYEINILCDGEGCTELLTTEPVASGFESKAIIAVMIHNHWVTMDGKHYCPKCFIIERDKKKATETP